MLQYVSQMGTHGHYLSINLSIKPTLILREIRESMFGNHSALLLSQHRSIPAPSTGHAALTSHHH